jgi:hypothetical protein
MVNANAIAVIRRSAETPRGDICSSVAGPAILEYHSVSIASILTDIVAVVGNLRLMIENLQKVS